MDETTNVFCHCNSKAHHLSVHQSIGTKVERESRLLITAISTASSSTLMEEYLECKALASALDTAMISDRAGLESSPNAMASNKVSVLHK